MRFYKEVHTEKEKEPSILVVEDEVIVAIDIVRSLTSLGYHVIDTVDTGEKALEKLKEITPDLILMDVRLKGNIDGIQTAEIIRKAYHIPYIYLSTFTDKETLSRAKMTEPYGYIMKSSHKNDLHSMIEMALYRHKMERSVKEKEELYAVTLKSVSDAVIGSTLDGNIISWNRGAEQLFGYTEEEIIGKNLSVLTPPFFPNEIPQILDQMVEGKELDHYETVRQNKTGEIINVSIKVSPIKDILSKIVGVSIIARDITSKKKMEKELLEVAEKERRAIGQDLHDSLGQNLTGVSLQLKALENRLRDKGLADETASVEMLSKHVKDAIMQTKNLAKNLLTVTLQNQGIQTALQELASYSESLYGIRTMCETKIEEELADPVIIAQLYYIAQEAIANAGKHASPTLIKVLLQADSSEIVLQVQDNGNGLSNADTKGFGKRIMEFRSNMINGNLSIFRNGENGTTVFCRVPLMKKM